MRALFLVACSATLWAAPADDYFELGLDYLRKGFYGRARAAFAESLVRAPGEAVPALFHGVAATAEGRPALLCARLLRGALLRVPKGQRFETDLNRRLPSPRALELVRRDHARALRTARGRERRARLEILAFLEVFDGTPKQSDAMKELCRVAPKDAYVRALSRSGSPCSSPTTSPTGAAPSSAR